MHIYLNIWASFFVSSDLFSLTVKNALILFLKQQRLHYDGGTDSLSRLKASDTFITYNLLCRIILSMREDGDAPPINCQQQTFLFNFFSFSLSLCRFATFPTLSLLVGSTLHPDCTEVRHRSLCGLTLSARGLDSARRLH